MSTGQPGAKEALSIASFFKDPDASSVITAKAVQIAAPVVRGQDVTASELMQGGGIRILKYVLDRSPSMENVGPMLLDDFNNELVPAIMEAREDDTSVLRIGGISFSTDITPIWGKGGVYYHALKDLPRLTSQEYNPQVGSGTSLHQAILDATTLATKYAAELQAQRKGNPDIDIIILSDGANNEHPRDPGVVKKVINGSDTSRIRYIYFYFETAGGMSDPKAYASQKLGIDPENIQVFAQKPGETAAERKKRFRRMMRVMSKVSASKGKSAVQAAAAAAATPTPDDDVV